MLIPLPLIFEVERLRVHPGGPLRMPIRGVHSFQCQLVIFDGNLLDGLQKEPGIYVFQYLFIACLLQMKIDPAVSGAGPYICLL